MPYAQYCHLRDTYGTVYELIEDIVRELEEYGVHPVLCDPCADTDEAHRLYGVSFVNADEIREMDAVIVSVAHEAFRALTPERIDAFYGEGKKVLLDVKAMYSRANFENRGYVYWRL